MFSKIKFKIYNFLRYLEKWTKTDMVYLTRGGFWLTLGQFISSGSSFLLSIAFANLLPKETYGSYRYILSICSILAIATLSGMGTAITRAVARGHEGSFGVAIKTKLRWGSLGGLASLMLAGYYYFGHNNEFSIAFLLAAIFLPIMEAVSLYDSFLQGRKYFKKSTLYSAWSQIIATTALITTIFLTQQLYIIFFVYLLSWTLVRSLFLLITIKHNRLNDQVDESAISYGKNLSAMNIIMTVANYLDRLLVFHFLGAAQLAVYSVAIAPPEQIKGLLKNIATLAFPKMANRDKAEVISSLKNKMYRFFIVCFPIMVLYILLAPQIFNIFFPRYHESVLLSQLFAFSLIFSMSILPLTALQSQKMQAALYKFNIYAAIIQIGLLIVFIYFWGIIGIIIARILMRFITLIISVSLLTNKSE